MGGIYGDEFEKNMNVLTSPANIKETARKFVEFEKANGPYSFGMFAKTLLPRPADRADEYGSTKGYNNWEKHAGSIPKEVTERITSVAFSNYRSDSPLPMLMKIGANVDATYDVQIKNFIHDGVEYIGILMLLSESGAQVPGEGRATRKGVGLNRDYPTHAWTKTRPA
jgi:hypothetical protein